MSSNRTEGKPGTSGDTHRTSKNDSLQLLDLDEAVAFLRGAYARRTLQNKAWSGQLRYIGRGRRMRFAASWLLEDLLALHTISSKEQGHESQGKAEQWNSDEAHPSAATIGASVRAANSRAAQKKNASYAARRRNRASRSSGSSMASGSASSPTAGAKQTRPRFFAAKKRTTGDNKISV